MTIDDNWRIRISWKQICIMYDCQICKVNTWVLSNGSHFKTQNWSFIGHHLCSWNAKMKICCKFFIGGNFHDVRIICMLGHIDIKIKHKYLKLNSPLQKRKGIFKSFTQRVDIIIVISANGGMLVMYINFILYLNEN